MKQVVAGILVRDRKILVCQRTRHQTMPMKWEFPGGKIEEGEQPRDALRRERTAILSVWIMSINGGAADLGSWARG